MVELLVTTFILSFISLGVAKSTVVAYKTSNHTRAESVAMQMAIETMEEYTSINPQTLADDSDTTDPIIVREGLSFSRVVDVTIDANRSRNVQVTVESNSPLIEVRVSIFN